MFEEMFGLVGQRALVTGASSGLGRHFSLVLAKAGADLVLGARRREPLEETAELVRASGRKCETIVLDVSDKASIVDASAAFADVDILVNNAGIVREAMIVDAVEDDWDAVVDTNLNGVFLMTQAIARAMIARGSGGTIINIASILGQRQTMYVSSYCASKAAVIQFSKTSALELARHEIRVNALAPGYFETDLNEAFFASDAGTAMLKRVPQRRLGNLSELDGALLLLAGPSGSFMTGSIVNVDGGHMLSTL